MRACSCRITRDPLVLLVSMDRADRWFCRPGLALPVCIRIETCHVSLQAPCPLPALHRTMTGVAHAVELPSHFTSQREEMLKSVWYLWCPVAWYFTCKSLVDVQTLPCPGRAMEAVHKIPRPTMGRQPWPDMHSKKQHSQQKSCEPATPAKHEEQHTLLLCKRHVGFCKEACSGLLQFSLHRTSWTNLSSPTSLIICILPGHIGCCYPTLGSRTCCAWLAAPNDALWHRNARQ